MSVVVDYLIYAVEQEKEQAAWELWKSLYPFMAIEWLKPIKFEKFKEELFQKQYRYTKNTRGNRTEMLAVVAAYKGR